MSKIIFQDEEGQNLNRYKLTPVDGQTDIYDLERMANITKQGTPYNKETGDHFLQVEDGIPVQSLACTKSTTVYSLTGLTATTGKASIMFAAPTAYAAGDTVTINGIAYTLKTIDGTTLTTGAWAVGAIIQGTVDLDNKVLYVSPSAPVGAIQAATLGGAAVSKSGTTLQFPAYPTSLPANGGNANYANTAGSAPANGGNSSTVGGYAPSAFLQVANSAPVKIQSSAPSDGTALWAW